MYVASTCQLDELCTFGFRARRARRTERKIVSGREKRELRSGGSEFGQGVILVQIAVAAPAGPLTRFPPLFPSTRSMLSSAQNALNNVTDQLTKLTMPSLPQKYRAAVISEQGGKLEVKEVSLALRTQVPE